MSSGRRSGSQSFELETRRFGFRRLSYCIASRVSSVRPARAWLAARTPPRDDEPRQLGQHLLGPGRSFIENPGRNKPGFGVRSEVDVDSGATGRVTRGTLAGGRSRGPTPSGGRTSAEAVSGRVAPVSSCGGSSPEGELGRGGGRGEGEGPPWTFQDASQCPPRSPLRDRGVAGSNPVSPTR